MTTIVGDHPSWTLYIQVMPFTDADDYRFNPFDLTNVWPHGDYPLIQVGRMVRSVDQQLGDRIADRLRS